MGVIALAALVAMAVFAGPAQSAFPGANGKIAYLTTVDGNPEIHSFTFTPPFGNAGDTRLTNNPATDSDPAWSPNGTQIAFVSNRDGNFEIYKMNADGTGQTRLTHNAAFDADVAWSGDGTQLVFASDRDGNFNIFKMSASGDSNGTIAPTRLTTDPGHDGFPAWSPDGTKIAFDSDRSSNTDVWKMNADGTGQVNLTSNSAEDALPNWSPDGKKIAFQTSRSANGDIYAMNPDGTGQAFLEGTLSETQYGNDKTPAWSPDGKQMAWSSDGGGATFVIWVGTVPQSSSGSSQLAGELPDWQPVVHTYVRPRGATPTRISLVPAYAACTAPNATHRSPISSSSCVPPTASSNYLTVGTPDFNGQASNSVGYVLFRVQSTTPEDIQITVNDTDVRCAGTSGGCSSGALSDYTDDLRFDASFRITDKGNGGAGSGTVTDLPVRFSVPCTTTTSTTVGSTCSINTSINTLFGATAITDSQRAIWQQTDVVKLFDGGADGVASTTADNTLFATGGLFAP